MRRNDTGQESVDGMIESALRGQENNLQWGRKSDGVMDDVSGELACRGRGCDMCVGRKRTVRGI